MSQIYIIYSDRDREQVGRLVSLLENEGYPCFFRMRDLPRINYATVQAAIKSAPMILVVVGEKTHSDNAVMTELVCASDLHKPITVAALQNAEIKNNLSYYLAMTEAVQVAAEEGEQTLLSQVRKIMSHVGPESGKDTSSDPKKPYNGSDPYIFISYSHKDKEKVFPIIRKLQDQNYRVWYDEGIDPATEWDDNIAHHISSCGCLIAFISENYIHSNNCKDEINFARDLDLPRLLVYLEETNLPLGMSMRLMRIQAIHAYKYEDKADFYNKLLSASVLEPCR